MDARAALYRLLDIYSHNGLYHSSLSWILYRDLAIFVPSFDFDKVKALFLCGTSPHWYLFLCIVVVCGFSQAISDCAIFWHLLIIIFVKKYHGRNLCTS